MLESNLRTLYQSVKCSSSNNLPLVANFSGTHIYSSRKGWGRLWCWFYQITEQITGKNLHSIKLKKAVIFTHNAFHRQLDNVSKDALLYQEYLKKCSKGYAVDESTYFLSRKTITKWNKTTAPFVKMMQSLHNEAMKNLLNDCFPPNLHDPKLPFFATPEAIHLRRLQKVIDLEGIIGGPLPLNVFKKILKDKPLNTIDHKDLENWIQVVNKAAPNGKSVHQALEVIVQFYQKPSFQEQSFIPACAVIEKTMEDKGCLIFQNEDQKQQKWRRQLKEGDKVSFKDFDIFLGPELEASKQRGDQTRVYRLEGCNDCVAVIAYNRTLLPLRLLRMQQPNQLKIGTAQVKAISKDERVMLIERLFPLHTIRWKTSGEKINALDLPLLKSLSEALKTQVLQKQTPSCFCSAYLMFDANYCLKAIRPLVLQAFDFNALEDFAFACAGGNLAIFKSLIIRSGLSAHPIVKFYRDLITNLFKGDTIAVDDLAGIYKIEDGRIVSRAEALIQELKKMHKQLVEELCLLFPNRPQKLVSKKTVDALISCYRSHESIGTFWPTLAQETMEKVKLSMR